MFFNSAFRDIVNDTLGIIIKFNKNGKIVMLNKSAEDELGYQEGEEIYVWDVFRLIFKKTTDLEEFMKENKNNQIESVVYRKNKTCFPVELRFGQVNVSNGFYVCSVTNTNTQVELIKELVRAEKDAKEALKVRNEFVANVTHELRTPVNGIKGHVKYLMEQDNIAREYIRTLQVIDRCCDNMSEIINNILDFSKMNAGKMMLDEKEFRLRECLKYVIDTNIKVANIKGKTGIELQQKKILIIGRMENYLIKNGYPNYNEYMNVVEKDTTGKETENLVNILTTNHTYFMREFEHMEFLKNRVLPELKQTNKESRDLRIWSAASSTGEEPYTIAMILNDFFALDSINWDTTILATDISTEVLQFAAKGQYLREQIEPLPDTWKKRYFKAIEQDKFEVKPELKKAVLFRQFNLINSFPFKRKLHVVFIRNVMIYFEKDTKHKLLQKIYDFMEPGGYLFIGTTESIDRDCTNFQYVCPSVYKKVE